MAKVIVVAAWREAAPWAVAARAAVAFNRDTAAANVTIDWAWLDWPTPSGKLTKATVRDLWRRQDMGTHKGSLEVEVPPHGVVALRIEAAAAAQ